MPAVEHQVVCPDLHEQQIMEYILHSFTSLLVSAVSDPGTDD